MRARVRLLRRYGMPTSRRSPAPEDWVDGYLETATELHGHRVTRKLVVRHLMSAPGAGILHGLFQPALVSIDAQSMRLRGTERVRRPDDPVDSAVMQEWIVEIGP
jgi:hypothetical protein